MMLRVFLHTFLLCCLLSTSSSVSVEYLRQVNRLQSTSVDHYFCCNVVGTTLQWIVNLTSVGGYGVSDAGRVLISSGIHFNSTSSLLSVEPQEQQHYAMFDSVLVITVKGDGIPLDVACTNNINISSTSNAIPKYSGFHEDNHLNIALEYVVAARIIQNSSLLTHIFVCGTNSLSQVLGVDGEGVGFDSSDAIGDTRTILSNNDQVVGLQAVLRARQPYESTSFVFVSRNSNFTLICAVGSTAARIEAPHSAFSVNLPVTTSQVSTSAIPSLFPTLNLSSETTEFTTADDATDVKLNSIDATDVKLSSITILIVAVVQALVCVAAGAGIIIAMMIVKRKNTIIMNRVVSESRQEVGVAPAQDGKE